MQGMPCKTTSVSVKTILHTASDIDKKNKYQRRKNDTKKQFNQGTI
jgi:hypothetical protein